ncbi:MAG: DUF393 domain-containing protein [Planctomycetes bacterium]|nr:DUF393 domain-containing protein [Planctomycetota bacterium]
MIDHIDTTASTAPRCGTVYYDGACGLCSGWLSIIAPVIGAYGFAAAPLQTPGAQQRLGIDSEHLLDEFRLLAADGRVFEGADVYLYIWAHIWWTWPLYALFALPGPYQLMRATYRFFRRYRYLISKECALKPRLAPQMEVPQAQRPQGTDARAHGEADAARRAPPAASARIAVAWAPVVMLPAFTLAFGHGLAAWAFMWLLAFAIFAGFKWLTWRRACEAGVTAWPQRHLAYLFLWPGMDAHAFLAAKGVQTPSAIEWLAAIAKTALGALLFWTAARYLAAEDLLLAGWTGMAGAIFFLHFGLFHLLALAWQAAGVKAERIMRAPLFAESLSEFWSARWNVALRDITHGAIFTPIAKRCDARTATLAVFLLSGLIHDLVISVPAGAWYGLPTSYFALQGLGVIFEHSNIGRAAGLRHGWRGRAFALACVATPAFALFHSVFVLRVFVPFMRAAGAL